ncbi:hypothetical protein LCGC14_0941270 [marine sediment metagenome]|uniref:Uncharacterized protein n=1 Tax=marine sediment metagenome TaxID=412755 RepID=A0A0F9NK11_9ZZZZ
MDEIRLLLDRIIDRKKAESDAWSGKSSTGSRSGDTALVVDSDESLRKVEMMHPGSVVSG